MQWFQSLSRRRHQACQPCLSIPNYVIVTKYMVFWVVQIKCSNVNRLTRSA
jgi:hypothetical protein